MRSLNHRYAQSFNGRHRLVGPFWQGRLPFEVEDGAYLQQRSSTSNRNPVTAGVVKDPAGYRWSGHGEVLRGRGGRGLIDVDETLAAFEPTRRAATPHYRRAMAAAEGEEWMGEGPGQLAVVAAGTAVEEGGGRARSRHGSAGDRDGRAKHRGAAATGRA